MDDDNWLIVSQLEGKEKRRYHFRGQCVTFSSPTVKDKSAAIT